MFKFLRKYNKWILAVGGTLLMLVFLIPEAIQNLSQSAGVSRATRATVGEDNQKIPAGEWAQVEMEAELIKRLERQGPAVPQIGPIEGSQHWYLLTREADQAGLIGSPNAISYSEEQILNISANLGMDRETVRRTVAKLEGVLRLINLYGASGAMSDLRLKQFAARAFHTVETEMIVVTADAEAVDYAPSDEELERHLEQYRDVRPGEGEMGFGYRLPDRVKLEWLTISAERVREMIRNSDAMNTVNLRYHWSRNPDNTFPPVDPAANHMPQSVQDHLLRTLTEEKLAEIEKFASDQLRANQRGIPQRQGYFELPDDWETRRLGLRDLAEQVQERFGVELPAYRAIGNRWVPIDEVGDLEGIGRASTTRFGPTPRRLPEITAATRNFGGSQIMQIQEGIAGPTLRDDENNIYVFRIVDTDPSRPPQSIDEVRDALVRDLRRLAHYQRLAETLSVLENEARESTMLAVAMEREADLHTARVTLCSLDALFMRMQSGEPIELIPSSLPVIGRHLPTAEAIVDYALNLPDVPTAELTPQQRVFGLPVQDHLAVLIVRIIDQQPLTRSFYTSLVRGQTPHALLLSQELGGLQQTLRETFSYEALSQRHNFMLLGGSAEEEELPLSEDDAAAGDT